MHPAARITISTTFAGALAFGGAAVATAPAAAPAVIQVAPAMYHGAAPGMHYERHFAGPAGLPRMHYEMHYEGPASHVTLVVFHRGEGWTKSIVGD